MHASCEPVLEPFLQSSLSTTTTYYRQFIVHLVSVQLLTFKVNIAHRAVDCKYWTRIPRQKFSSSGFGTQSQPPPRLAASGHPSWPSIEPDALSFLLLDQVFETCSRDLPPLHNILVETFLHNGAELVLGRPHSHHHALISSREHPATKWTTSSGSFLSPVLVWHANKNANSRMTN